MGNVGKAPVGFRRPGCHGARRGREGRAFAQAEQHARDDQRDEAARETRQHGGACPDDRAQRERAARAEAVAHPSADDLKHEIRISERGKHESDLRMRQAQLRAELSSRGADIDPVDIGDEIHRA